MLRSLVFAWPLLAACSPCSAGVVIDQFFPGSNSGVSTLSPSRQIAQTFPTTRRGSLHAVDVWINGEARTRTYWEIRRTENGVPLRSDDAVLASGRIIGPDVPKFPDLPPTRLDLSGFNIPVSPGDILAVALRVEARNTGWRFHPSSGNPGTRFERAPGADWAPDDFFPDRPLGFATLIQPAPEPSAIAVWATLATLAGCRRKR